MLGRPTADWSRPLIIFQRRRVLMLATLVSQRRVGDLALCDPYPGHPSPDRGLEETRPKCRGTFSFTLEGARLRQFSFRIVQGTERFSTSTRQDLESMIC